MMAAAESRRELPVALQGRESEGGTIMDRRSGRTIYPIELDDGPLLSLPFAFEYDKPSCGYSRAIRLIPNRQSISKGHPGAAQGAPRNDEGRGKGTTDA